MRKFTSALAAIALTMLGVIIPASISSADETTTDETSVVQPTETPKAEAPAEEKKAEEPAPEPEKAKDPAPEPEKAKPVSEPTETTQPVADKPVKQDPKKFFVCKYVGTPGDNEQLQTGQNPISVSENAVDGGVGSYFNNKHGRSYVLAEDTGQAEPSVSNCPKADAFEPYIEHARWLVPAEVGNPNGKTVDSSFFPQPRLGTLPCGRWEQADTYGIDNPSDKNVFESLGDLLTWVNGHPEDSAIYKSHSFIYGGDCPPPVKALVKLDYSKVCGAITLKTVNNEAVNPGWYYGLQGKVDDVRVVSAVQKGPGTKETTKAFDEDYNGGSVTVKVSVYAATEQDLLPAEWPNLTTVVDVVVDTDCIPPQPPARVLTDWAETCDDGGYRSDRTGTQAYVLVEGEWVLGEVIVWGDWVNTPFTDDEYFTKCAPDKPTKDPLAVTGQYGGAQPTCEVPSVEWTRTITTTTYTYAWNVETRVWDETATPVVVVDPVTETHALTAGELRHCTVPASLVKVITDEGFTCDGRYLQDTTTTTAYIWDAEAEDWILDTANAVVVVGEWKFDRKLTSDEKDEFNCVAKTTPNDKTLAFTGPSDGTVTFLLYGGGMLGIGIIILTLLGIAKRREA